MLPLSIFLLIFGLFGPKTCMANVEVKDMIEIKDNDFSEYYDLFYFENHQHYLTKSKYGKELDNKTTTSLYDIDADWHLKFYLVPNQDYFIELTFAQHFAIFDPIPNPKIPTGWRRYRVYNVDKNFDKAFMYGNYLIYNNNGDALDVPSIRSLQDETNSTAGDKHLLNIKDLKDVDTSLLNSIHKICFDKGSRHCVIDSTGPKRELVVSTVSAVYQANNLTLYFLDQPDNPNLYCIKDELTEKHYRFPLSINTYKQTNGYENAKLKFRIPVLTNLKDNFFKKYR